jgi:hypothetical protein
MGPISSIVRNFLSSHSFFHLSKPEHPRDEDRTSAADSGESASPNPLRLPEDLDAVKAGELERRQEAGVSAVSGRGFGAALQAGKAEMRGGEPPRTRQGHNTESGVEPGLRRGSARGRRTKSPVSSRLAANFLANKLPKTHFPGDTGKGDRSNGPEVVV